MAAKMLLTVRVKPSENHSPALLYDDEAVTINRAQSSFTYKFNKVFGPSASQKQVFNDLAQPIVQGCLEGRNGCIMAYGQTGSGKTHTMMGLRPLISLVPTVDDGIIPQSLEYIFKKLNEDASQFSIKCMVIEIYKDIAYDLLGSSTLENKKKVECSFFGNSVDGYSNEIKDASQVEVENYEQAIFYLNNGLEMRQTNETQLNEKSSRSHFIFTLLLNVRTKNGQDLDSQLSFVDLAGRENVKQSGASGEVFQEAITINETLFSFKIFLKGFADKKQHLYVRDGKLAKILYHSFGPNSQAAMISCIRSTDQFLTSSKDTLLFTQDLRNFTNSAKVCTPKTPFQFRNRLRPIATNNNVSEAIVVTEDLENFDENLNKRKDEIFGAVMEQFTKDFGNGLQLSDIQIPEAIIMSLSNASFNASAMMNNTIMADGNNTTIMTAHEKTTNMTMAAGESSQFLAPSYPLAVKLNETQKYSCLNKTACLNNTAFWYQIFERNDNLEKGIFKFKDGVGKLRKGILDATILHNQTNAVVGGTTAAASDNNHGGSVSIYPQNPPNLSETQAFYQSMIFTNPESAVHEADMLYNSATQAMVAARQASVDMNAVLERVTFLEKQAQEHEQQQLNDGCLISALQDENSILQNSFNEILNECLNFKNEKKEVQEACKNEMHEFKENLAIKVKKFLKAKKELDDIDIKNRVITSPLNTLPSQ